MDYTAYIQEALEETYRYVTHPICIKRVAQDTEFDELYLESIKKNYVLVNGELPVLQALVRTEARPQMLTRFGLQEDFALIVQITAGEQTRKKFWLDSADVINFNEKDFTIRRMWDSGVLPIVEEQQIHLLTVALCVTATADSVRGEADRWQKMR